MATAPSLKKLLNIEPPTGGVLRLTLNNPKRRNALSQAMLSEIGAAIEMAHNNPDVRVVIISANGPVFSSGHDLKEMTEARDASDKGRAFYEELLAQCSAVMQAIVACDKPVIAEVAGTATAAGCQLVASCDLVIAADTARFATPGVNLGTFCSTPMVALSRNVSHKHAMEMLLTGDMLPASRAEEMGLINRAVAPDMLVGEVNALAAKIASKSTQAMTTGKRAFYAQREKPLSEAYEYASKVMTENLMGSDTVEGVSAFFEKRTPNWPG